MFLTIHFFMFFYFYFLPHFSSNSSSFLFSYNLLSFPWKHCVDMGIHFSCVWVLNTKCIYYRNLDTLYLFLPRTELDSNSEYDWTDWWYGVSSTTLVSYYLKTLQYWSYMEILIGTLRWKRFKKMSLRKWW